MLATCEGVAGRRPGQLQRRRDGIDLSIVVWNDDHDVRRTIIDIWLSRLTMSSADCDCFYFKFCTVPLQQFSVTASL